MLWGDNFLMQFKFVEFSQTYNFGFHKIVDIQLCLHLHDFFHLVNSVSYVYLTLLKEIIKAIIFLPYIFQNIYKKSLKLMNFMKIHFNFSPQNLYEFFVTLNDFYFLEVINAKLTLMF